MATLTGKQLKNSYQSLVTIKDADDANPTSGQLENGLGNPITALGIGTDSPTSALTVHDDDSANSTTLVLANSFATDTAGDSAELMFQLKRSYASGVNDAGFIKSVKEEAWDATDTRNSALTFGTRAGASEPTERLRIDSSGNVGIGETSPSAKLEIKGTDTEPLTVLNDTVYTFATNVSTAQSNTHTVTIPFTSQGANHSNFLVEIYASLNWSGATNTFAGRALYTLNTLTTVGNVAELEDVNNGNLSFSATSSGTNFIVTITTTAGSGQEPDRIGVMAKVIRGNGSVGNEPTSMTIA